MAYATFNDLFARYDRRVLAQLSNDENETAFSDAAIAAALDDATAEIKSAATVGGFYTSAQLDTLNGDALLARMACDLAAKFIAQRRGGGLPPEWSDRVDETIDRLNDIRKGARIFAVDVVLESDTPEIVTLTATEKSNLGELTATRFFDDTGDDKTTTG